MIAGSSMGGLMSVYAATVYNHVFGRAACLSPSLWVEPEKVRKMVERTDVGGDSVIYMDYGSQELANHEDILSILGKSADQLLKKGVHLSFRIVPGGTHCEASWEKQIPIFVECLELT